MGLRDLFRKHKKRNNSSSSPSPTEKHKVAQQREALPPTLTNDSTGPFTIDLDAAP